MPTLVIDNVPASLYNRIQDRAKFSQLSPTDTVLELLENGFLVTSPVRSEPPLPSEPFMTEEICAPFSIPRPAGTPVHAIRIAAPLPTPHDLPDEE